MNSNTPPDKLLSFALAFVGGFGDAAGFVLAKTFTGHITGNLVLGAIATAAHDWRSALTHVSAIACFLAGIPLTAVVARANVARLSWPLLPTVLATELILIVAAYFALAFQSAQGVEVFVLFLSLALGLQNASFRQTGGISVHTNYLTGTITGLLSAEAEKHTLSTAHRPSTDPKIQLLYGIWGAFVLGAGTGALMVFRFKERGILAVALILFALIIRSLTAARQAEPVN
jgi:uncharacterized membrane protein YoaK (UPF0700 family)